MHNQCDTSGWLPDVGGKLNVTAVRYQITDTGSSLEGDSRKCVCCQLVAAGAVLTLHSSSSRSPSPCCVYRQCSAAAVTGYSERCCAAKQCKLSIA